MRRQRGASASKVPPDMAADTTLDIPHLVPKASYFGTDRWEMLRFIPASARDFPDLGCGAGAVGAVLKATIPGVRVINIERVAAAAREARVRLDEVIALPIEEALDDLQAQTVTPSSARKESMARRCRVKKRS
jgi:hypothetical protein